VRARKSYNAFRIKTIHTLAKTTEGVPFSSFPLQPVRPRISNLEK
jgi:hypothetical protein